MSQWPLLLLQTFYLRRAGVVDRQAGRPEGPAEASPRGGAPGISITLPPCPLMSSSLRGRLVPCLPVLDPDWWGHLQARCGLAEALTRPTLIGRGLSRPHGWLDRALSSRCGLAVARAAQPTISSPSGITASAAASVEASAPFVAAPPKWANPPGTPGSSGRRLRSPC